VAVDNEVNNAVSLTHRESLVLGLRQSDRLIRGLLWRGARSRHAAVETGSELGNPLNLKVVLLGSGRGAVRAT
jgi:hypothetical protein